MPHPDVQSLLDTLRSEPPYYTGQIVYDLQRQSFAEVVQARPESASYELSNGHWVHASDMEDPLRGSPEGDARALLESSRRAALQGSVRRMFVLWLGMVVLQVGALSLAWWLS